LISKCIRSYSSAQACSLFSVKRTIKKKRVNNVGEQGASTSSLPHVAGFHTWAATRTTLLASTSGPPPVHGPKINKIWLKKDENAWPKREAHGLSASFSRRPSERAARAASWSPRCWPPRFLVPICPFPSDNDLLGCRRCRMHLACVASEALTFQRGGEENGNAKMMRTTDTQKAAPAAATLGGVVYQRSYTWTTQHHEIQTQSSTHANHKVVRSFRGTVVAVPFLLLLSSINFPTELGNGCMQFLCFLTSSANFVYSIYTHLGRA
jgi:hypothetical protein